jgi:hypothetical protein
VRGDAPRLPFDDDSFDLLVNGYMLEAGRAAKRPGGMLGRWPPANVDVERSIYAA